MVVQKRINTRIFQLGGKVPENPSPGTVLDHTVSGTILICPRLIAIADLAGDEEGLVRLLLGVAACRAGHRLTHPLHRCPRQHRPQARHHSEGELIL